MSPESVARRTIAFVNIAHAFDHFVLLIYPTAVLAIAAETSLAYGTLIGLSTGMFVAFGLFSLPMGWLADRLGRRVLFAAFFFGCGAACLGLSTAGSPLAFAGWLVVLGLFAAIYHPIGSAMLVGHARRLGRTLGVNGVFGNLGAALASGITAALTAWLGWRFAFATPGVLLIAAGIGFVLLVPAEGSAPQNPRASGGTIPVARPAVLLAAFALAIVAGGMTFNMLTIALPKVIDERLGLDLPLWLIGSLATSVFIFGALMQLAMGRLVDRYSLPAIFLMLSVLQPAGLALAAMSTGFLLLLGLVMAMASIYGQVVVNDAMVARYVPPAARAKAYSVRYFLGFTTSGLAVPLIAVLHEAAGFPLVLAGATAFGAAIFAASVIFFVAARGSLTDPVPAE